MKTTFQSLVTLLLGIILVNASPVPQTTGSAPDICTLLGALAADIPSCTGSAQSSPSGSSGPLKRQSLPDLCKQASAAVTELSPVCKQFLPVPPPSTGRRQLPDITQVGAGLLGPLSGILSPPPQPPAAPASGPTSPAPQKRQVTPDDICKEAGSEFEPLCTGLLQKPSPPPARRQFPGASTGVTDPLSPLLGLILPGGQTASVPSPPASPPSAPQKRQTTQDSPSATLSKLCASQLAQSIPDVNDICVDAETEDLDPTQALSEICKISIFTGASFCPGPQIAPSQD
ncbi:hypothetical protein BDQ17DRAFT_1031266 [Cyathus striatus]|nr:hypothetical protein BDQ17DRAFT_1031266 [Cyathus striatus]